MLIGYLEVEKLTTPGDSKTVKGAPIILFYVPISCKHGFTKEQSTLGDNCEAFGQDFTLLMCFRMRSILELVYVQSHLCNARNEHAWVKTE